MTSTPLCSTLSDHHHFLSQIMIAFEIKQISYQKLSPYLTNWQKNRANILVIKHCLILKEWSQEFLHSISHIFCNFFEGLHFISNYVRVSLFSTNSSLNKSPKFFRSSQIKSPSNNIENSNPEVVAGQNSILVVRKTRCKLSCNNIFSLQFWPKFILNLRVNWMEWMALESGWMLVVLLCWFYTIRCLIASLEL